VSFTALTDSSVVSLPQGWPSTPTNFVISMHTYYRTSVRIRLSFYCSAFLSARFIVLFIPAGAHGTPVYDIDNNLCRLIDVRGDTTVDFTIPFTSPYDFLPCISPTFGTMVVKLYDPIASVDTTSDPVIDLVVWSAAGPDCQFVNPTFSHVNDFLWPGDAEKQSDIHEDFQKEFPSFLDGCTYLVDNHYCVSETTEYVVDVLKRYATCSGGPGTAMPLDYAPSGNSVQTILLSAFKFRRGGVMYKVLTYETPVAATTVPSITQTTSGAYAVQLGYGAGGGVATFAAYGNAQFIQCDQRDVLDFSIPWNWVLPFSSQGSYTPQSGDPLFSSVFFPSDDNRATYATTNKQSSFIYTAVRDDYQIGMLQPPLSQLSPSGKARVSVDPAIRKLASRPVPRHKSGDFTVVHKAAPATSPSKSKDGMSFFSFS